MKLDQKVKQVKASPLKLAGDVKTWIEQSLNFIEARYKGAISQISNEIDSVIASRDRGRQTDLYEKLVDQSLS